MVPIPLVLLHGFTNTGASWAGVARALPERYRPLAPDLRGHGEASERRPVSVAEVIGDVGGLVEGPFELGGYSMGGRIALHAALALGDRVRRLILIGASPGLADPVERAQRRRADDALADEVETMTIDAFAQRWARTPVLAGQPPDVLAAVAAQRLRNTPAGLAASLRGVGTGALTPVWDQLGQIAIEVELIVGERDPKFRATAERMLHRLPDARLTVVPGAGHAVHLEAPAAVAAIIARTNR